MQYPDKHIEFCIENDESVFSGLSQKEKETVVAHHSKSRIKKGELIFRENEKSRGLISLASGKAKIYRPGIAGREHILRLIRPGDLMGLQILYSEGSWNATAMALEDSVTVSIERQFMIRLLRNNPEIALRTGRLLSSELTSSYDKMVSLTQKHVRGRLAESILMIGEIYGYEEDGKTLSARLSRNDIAHLSNMTTSNAIRTLSSFSSEGIIRIKRSQIAILDHDELDGISRQA